MKIPGFSLKRGRLSKNIVLLRSLPPCTEPGNQQPNLVPTGYAEYSNIIKQWVSIKKEYAR